MPSQQLWKSRYARWAFMILGLLGVFFWGVRYSTRINWNTARSIGTPMDSLDGIPVYYNGGVNQTHGRNTSPTGYNVGLRYQCVEFVKRYYLERYGHEMPDAYGHALDFFDPSVADGGTNVKRGLIQYRNGGRSRPQKGDLLVWKSSFWNPYGHVAIVSQLLTKRAEVEYIQQNPGPWGDARVSVGLIQSGQAYTLEDERILGWLRMP
jgi:CHAP domain